jgi:hypothetical protein
VEPIKFVAQVSKVQTLADGGLRVALDLPETAVAQAAALMETRAFGTAVSVEAVPVTRRRPDSSRR